MLVAPVALLVTVLVILVVPVLLAEGRPLGIDLAIRDAVGSGDVRLAATLTQLGSGAVLYPVLLALSWLRLRRGQPWQTAAAPVLVLAAAQMLEAVAFVPLGRPAPDGAGSVTFSSGHAMTALLGWGLVARHVTGRLAMSTAAAVAATVGVTRVLLGLHWATDVLAGWAFGAACLVAYVLVRRRTRIPEATAHRHEQEVAAVRAPGWATSPWAWGVTALAALVPLVPLVTVPASQRMKDLLVYVGAGGTAGSGADVYEFRTVYDMPFTYPPFAAMLSEPLARVPLPLLHLMWVLATLVALVALARVALGPVLLRLGLPLTLAVLLVSSPVRSHLRFGQVGIFLVLLVAVDLLRGGRRSGVGVGVAAAIKLTPAVFLPWLLVTRQWRSLRTAVLSAGGCTVLGLLVLWPSAQEYLWRALWDSQRFGPNDIPGNQSVRGMLLRTPLGEQVAELTWLALSVVLLVVATAGARRLYRAGNSLGALGVLAAASVAVSPISWVHHLVWLVLPLGALVAAGRSRIAAAWALLLILSLPSLGTAGLRSGSGHPVLWHLLIDAQGLTAVLAVVLLPVLVAPRIPGADPGAPHPKAMPHSARAMRRPTPAESGWSRRTASSRAATPPESPA